MTHLASLSCSLSHRSLWSSSPPMIPHRLFICRETFACVVWGQTSRSWIHQAVRCTALHKRFLWCGNCWLPVVRRGELPGSWTQHPLNKVPHSEEKKHNENPRQFAGNHSNVVINLVHEFLATSDGSGVISLNAADLVIRTKVVSTFSDGNGANKKASTEHCQYLTSVEKHPWCGQRKEMIQGTSTIKAWKTGCRRDDSLVDKTMKEKLVERLTQSHQCTARSTCIQILGGKTMDTNSHLSMFAH